MEKRIETPLTIEKVKDLKAGDMVLLSGTIYTGRDAAHKRMIETIQKGEDLPATLKDQVIYYVGPAPAKPGQVIGSCGPTTSGRMDAYAPKLLEMGLKGMIGKGHRDQGVIEAMKTYGAVYFTAIGGAGALLADRIEKARVIAYEDLGTEAIHQLVVKDFPVIVTIDMYGNNLYKTEKDKYRRIL